MKSPLPLAGLQLVKPRVFKDDRGFFLESYRRDWFDVEFVQDNHSRSAKNTVRGLHFQKGPGQAKLVRVASGTIFDVAVDIRPGSPTFGRWHGEVLDDVERAMMFVPTGFAHGFCVLSDSADVLYKVSTLYDPALESGFRWDDPDVGIDWPVKDPVLSTRDQTAPLLKELR